LAAFEEAVPAACGQAERSGEAARLMARYSKVQKEGMKCAAVGITFPRGDFRVHFGLASIN